MSVATQKPREAPSGLSWSRQLDHGGLHRPLAPVSPRVMKSEDDPEDGENLPGGPSEVKDGAR